MSITTESAWQAFSDQLRNFIARRAPTDAVDDLLSEVFIKVHTKIDTLADGDRLAPWLYRIARNTVTDHLRAVGRHGTVSLGDHDRTELAEASTAELDIAGGLRAMVEELPERYRQALILTEFEGLTQAQLGDELGLSLSGAKSRVQRARAMLKDELLACCHFEFDGRGRVIDYEPRLRCCEPGSPG